ncbi:cytochrome c oxidase accessory protein CcoG [Parasulfuritortus cantonensis]|uniref:Cytochrome c oxidase accessory protein CcoG n=1 Tax=Parasulfuritortus cantonensis TaxID=2528202 RepID=A0A4R1BGH4_9PROT|nr:cytochrome c oxidase accessory protein CcoG [Parasulfuritortus cantonensis]TCJ16291.1 cytochrome c oxidase accessory protein CcoG [Parasulfuritortus cantonensis]
MSTEPEEIQLYEVKQKIYPRAVQGVFNNWRIALVLFTQIVYYGLPWLTWDGRQAILFDLGARKFFLFGWVFWPQDFVWLAAILIMSALALFLFTAVAGRLWCGYACPQTVYTELFMWVESWIEGDYKKQQKLNGQPWNAEKIVKRGGKHVAWVVLSLWTGFTLVAYFTPATALLQELVTWTLGPWETFWIFFYALATWGFAGFMREQVCKYMCPYARFQSAMFDDDTLIITYDYQRGEPRGFRKKDVDHKAQGLGDCVDCGICVQVCPTGIDIRNGLQYMCIGCAACIDACDQVMEKVGYPKGLVRYSTQNVIDGKYPDQDILKHVFRPRTLFYTVVFSGIIVAFLVTLAMRIPLRVDVIRDRLTLSRESASGGIENIYRLQIINMDSKPHQYTISAKGIDGIKVASGDKIDIPALGTENLNVTLEAPRLSINRPTQPVMFEVRALDDERLVREAKSSFLK